jgi:hypothetical protein
MRGLLALPELLRYFQLKEPLFFSADRNGIARRDGAQIAADDRDIHGSGPVGR